MSDVESERILTDLRQWSKSLGFSHLGVSDIDLSQAEPHLLTWLSNGYHGEMAYMAKHGVKRSRPAELVPGTIRVITVRFPYLKVGVKDSLEALDHPDQAYIARYALGEDYHIVMKERLRALAEQMKAAVGPHGYRVFVDSAPVLEVEVAQKAGLGWRGKHTLLLSRDEGSFFFLGEIFTDWPLPVTPSTTAHCGSCQRCIQVCPTQAIVAPYQLDARRCIAYLTIELKGAIPVEFRSMIGQRVYGCDDCQLVCPWNKYAAISHEARFESKAALESASLVDLWLWTETMFNEYLQGSAIVRIGYERWRRNLAVGLGNAQASREIMRMLVNAYPNESALVQEHITWALDQQLERAEVELCS